MDSSVITAASNWLMQDPFPAHHNGGMVHGNGEMECNSRGDRPVALVAPVAHPGPRASAARPYKLLLYPRTMPIPAGCL
jgi:hypothetical protein